MHSAPMRVVMLCLVVCIFLGCTRDVAYRRLGPPEQCTETCSGTSSVEVVPYHATDTDPSGKRLSGNYTMSYIEFDDQGWFHEPKQRDALFQQIQRYRTQNTQAQFLIVVYAHGWKHNGSKDDGDVASFRKLLERMDAVEQRLAARFPGKKPRPVVGVYLGWRGSSLPLPLWIENITFWTRKNAGERVGERSVKQVLFELNEFRAQLNGWETTDKLANLNQTQLILIGHSFGGMVMYHALYSQLMERLLRLDEPAKRSYGVAKSFADFILLVNPAFEGSAYEPLHRAAMLRGCFPARQRPSLAVITSETDWATKYAFWFGRLYTYMQTTPQEEEGRAVRNTVGHLARYRTHTMTYEDSNGAAGASPTSLSETTVKQADQVVAAVENTNGHKYGSVQLEEAPNPVANFPHLVMLASRDIINGHNDIWNDRFVQFMVAYISAEIMNPKQSSAAEGKQECPPSFLQTAMP